MKVQCDEVKVGLGPFLWVFFVSTGFLPRRRDGSETQRRRGRGTVGVQLIFDSKGEAHMSLGTGMSCLSRSPVTHLVP